ncbi:hypothetical protein QR680_016399 [Steinernema hermaphroditum]|uniref:C2H2-type domain-containing protein n=1 Tax=Steinernema hermaphroditum TaxID=289476 RepID=A0AA39HC31_9BILA|nr:hypothetical protein QR680_016399 [Steinernema hermaphroditum]
MVPPSTPSSVRPLDVDTVVYNFVKRTKPELLLEMFGKNRCRELEQGDHRFDRSSFLSALEKIREDSKEEKCEAGETSERKEPSNTSKRSKVTITPELAVFDYFYERQNSQALKLLFDEEARKDYGRKVDRMGIHMPSVFRMYAYHRRLRLKHENKECTEIWKCQLCKKEFRGIGYGTLLMNHIGVHERIPIPCVIDGCEKILHYPGGLFHHLKRTHVRYVEHLTAQQFYRYKKSQKRFYKKAKKLYDKYFPPESFIRFNDTKMTCTSRDFEDPKCRECGEIVDHSIARRVHTAQHLGLVYNCVFDGCDVQLILSHLSPHYNCRMPPDGHFEGYAEPKRKSRARLKSVASEKPEKKLSRARSRSLSKLGISEFMYTDQRTFTPICVNTRSAARRRTEEQEARARYCRSPSILHSPLTARRGRSVGINMHESRSISVSAVDKRLRSKYRTSSQSSDIAVIWQSTPKQSDPVPSHSSASAHSCAKRKPKKPKRSSAVSQEGPGSKRRPSPAKTVAWSNTRVPKPKKKCDCCEHHPPPVRQRARTLPA